MDLAQGVESEIQFFELNSETLSFLARLFVTTFENNL